MANSSALRRLTTAAAAAMMVITMLGVGAAPARATYGETTTEVFISGDTELQYGEPVAFWARVSDTSDSCGTAPGGCDTPLGLVAFYAVSGSDQVYLTEVFLESQISGVATTPTTEFCCLPVGSYDSIRGYASPYGGDPSSGDAGPVSVERNGSTITLQADDTSIDVGSSVEFHIHLAGYEDDPHATQPTGTVDVYEGPTNYGTAFVDANGNATITTNQLPFGQHFLRARWGGDVHWTASTSAPLQVMVGGGTTATTISTSTTSTTYGADVTLTGTVVPVDPSTGTPTGPVGFHEGLSFLGSGNLNEGSPNVATLTTNELAVGSHILFAVYTGDGLWDASGSTNTVTVTISKASTSTSVVSSANPSTFGQAVTLTATVDGPGTTTVPGTVQFRDGAANLGAPQSLVLGQASLTVGSLGGGSHSITAVYSGSTNYLGSTSAALGQTVTCDQLITGTVGSVTALPGESTCLSGAKVTGGITVPDGASLSIVNSTVTGSVTVTASSAAASVAGLGVASIDGAGSVTICGSTIGGNVRVTGVAGFVLIGDRLEDACAGNTIKGTVSIMGTSGGLVVADNRIGGGVTVADNVGAGPAGHAAPEVKANRIGGFLNCYGNTPAVTDDGHPNIVRGWVRFG